VIIFPILKYILIVNEITKFVHWGKIDLFIRQFSISFKYSFIKNGNDFKDKSNKSRRILILNGNRKRLKIGGILNNLR